MHRSGTSLVANVLKNAGLDVGRDVSGPGLGNRLGHFEDQDFYRLHEDMLAAAGESCFTAGEEFSAPASADFERRARRLVAERETLPLWGWKDPRTCLFLDFWHPILPEACYFFLYRHPVDVALSLWRRNTDLELRQDPWLAMQAWEVYNGRLLEFCERNADRCFLAQIPALTADLSELVRRLRLKLGVPLQDGCAAAHFVPEELAPHPAPSLAWEELIPGALTLYQRLEERADLPARETKTRAEQQSLRERELLRACELLFYELLERNGRGGPIPPLDLRQTYNRLRVQEEAALAREFAARTELQAELERERQRTKELLRVQEEAALARERVARTVQQAELERERRQAKELLRIKEEAAFAREREARTELQAELERERRRTKELAAVLSEIEGSRSFALVRGWWRLRRLKRRQT